MTLSLWFGCRVGPKDVSFQKLTETVLLPRNTVPKFGPECFAISSHEELMEITGGEEGVAALPMCLC